jgi:membrane-associated protease RseP (regulator of RpoE activity)
MAWVLFLAGLGLLVGLHLTVMALASKWAKLEPTAVEFGFGPKLLRRTVGGLELRLGAVPLGGSVSMARQDAPLGRRLVPIVLAAASLLLLGALAVGPTEAGPLLRDAMVLPFTGALSPNGTAQDSLRRITHAIAYGDARSTLGTSALVLGSWNLVMGSTMAASSMHRAVGVVVPLVSLVLLLPWAYAWFVFLT